MPKNPFGVLILHGITGTPENVRNVAPPLEALGLLCSLPTLRGHGAETAEALRHVTWQEWMEDAENALFELLNETEKVIVIGHSMGGWIALNLAVDHKDKIDSLIVAGASTKVVSPLAPGRPLHFLFPLMLKLFKKWKRMKRRLKRKDWNWLRPKKRKKRKLIRRYKGPSPSSTMRTWRRRWK